MLLQLLNFQNGLTLSHATGDIMIGQKISAMHFGVLGDKK